MNIFERAREAWMVFRGRDHPIGPNIRGKYYEPRDWTSPDNWGKGTHTTQFTPGGGNGGGVNWPYAYLGPSSSDRPDRVRLSPMNEKSIVISVFNRIALDVAMVEFHHAAIDENDNFKEVIKGSIEEALSLEANVDETSFAYMVDLVLSMFDEGVVAEVPVECDRDSKTRSITDKEPLQLRLGRVAEWRPQQVKVNLYNELTGMKEDIDVDKREVCIIENPFYSVVNLKNGILARLTRKMALLDQIDERQGDSKINAIFQLPYIVRTDVQRATARARMKEMEDQLEKSKYGLTYIDGTEKMITLNRPIGEGLQSQIEWMTDLFLSQLCMTREILNGTADPKTMANYMQRNIGVICTAIAQERRRKLLTKKQRDNGESIVFVQDPFRLTPVTELAELIDKSTRNAIMSPNEWRGIIGYKPSDDATSDMLVNRNMPMAQTPGGAETNDMSAPEEEQAYPVMQQSVIPMNRQQRRQLERSKVPRGRSG